MDDGSQCSTRTAWHPVENNTIHERRKPGRGGGGGGGGCCVAVAAGTFLLCRRHVAPRATTRSLPSLQPHTTCIRRQYTTPSRHIQLKLEPAFRGKTTGCLHKLSGSYHFTIAAAAAARNALQPPHHHTQARRQAVTSSQNTFFFMQPTCIHAHKPTLTQRSPRLRGPAVR